MERRQDRFGLVQHLADFHPLLPAEEIVVAGLATGDFDRLGDGSRPDAPEPGRLIRAAFLRFLILGGDDEFRPHEKGIRLSGAYVGGVLDLEACHVVRDIGLTNCRFDSTPVLNSAVIERLFLDGSAMPGLNAERVQARGGLYLRGAEVSGAARLASATFGGAVLCDGSVFSPVAGPAFDAEGIEARRLHMRGARCDGPVILTGAELAGDLDCASMEVAGEKTGIALDARAVDVGGSVILRGARIAGETNLVAARIRSDLSCTAAHLRNPGGAALQISRATVGGAFFLRDGAAIEGTLAMTAAVIGSIHDDAGSWPGAGDLLLNRCLYQAFIGGPVDAASRLDWLSRQAPERWGEDFWPQPYEQLAAVLQDMGHEGDARTVLVEKDRLQRRTRRAAIANPLVRGVHAAIDAVLKVTVGYGRQPLLAFVWLFFLWVLGVLLFGLAEGEGAFRPTNPVLLRQPEWTLCGLPAGETVTLATGEVAEGIAAPGEGQLACFRSRREAASFPVFSPWMYSLDNLLPVLDLQQKDFWSPYPISPVGILAWAYFYLQGILGWTLSLLAVAGFSGLVRIR